MDPTPAQVERLLSHCGGARFGFNTMLAAVKANLDQRTAERSYGINDGELTPSMKLVGVRAAEGMEPTQADGGAVVGREQQTRLPVRLRQPRSCARELVEGTQRHPRRHHGVPEVQVQAPHHTVVHVLRRRAAGRRSAACGAARPGQHPVAPLHQEAGQARRGRHRPHHWHHHLLPPRTVVRRIHGSHRTHPRASLPRQSGRARGWYRCRGP